MSLPKTESVYPYAGEPFDLEAALKGMQCTITDEGGVRLHSVHLFGQLGKRPIKPGVERFKRFLRLGLVWQQTRTGLLSLDCQNLDYVLLRDFELMGKPTIEPEHPVL